MAAATTPDAGTAVKAAESSLDRAASKGVTA